ncbi:MAG: alpha/beta hydrolase, partial [Flavobacteriaceae bacterium]|nr:alpha/beta hydrolase [Flavobacteriaceae bacterium]
MTNHLHEEGKFTYLKLGEGTPIVVLHGLMGGLSNFDGVSEFFPPKGYQILIPELPIYQMPLLKTTVKRFAEYVSDFIDHMGFEKVILLGNSLGGHIGLLCTKLFPNKIQALVITGSSGLYESAMGESYPKRGDRDYIRKKAENVFYDPQV